MCSGGSAVAHRGLKPKRWFTDSLDACKFSTLSATSFGCPVDPEVKTNSVGPGGVKLSVPNKLSIAAEVALFDSGGSSSSELSPAISDLVCATSSGHQSVWPPQEIA